MATVVVQAGYMSGDMFGVAAALKLDRDLYVVVVHDASDKAQAEKMIQLYLSSVQDFSADKRLDFSNADDFVKARARPARQTNARIKLMAVANSEDFYKSMQQSSTLSLQQKKAQLRGVLPDGVLRDVTFRAMGATTEAVAFRFELDQLQGELANLTGPRRMQKLRDLARTSSPTELETLKTVLEKRGGAVSDMVKFHFDNVGGTRRALIEQWRIQDFDELAIQRFLNRKGIAHNEKYLFLWVRQSGKQGGAHPEHDASMVGWQQIIDTLPLKYTPVLIGDKFVNGTLRSTSGKLRNLTEFWNEMPFCLYKHSKFVGAEARLAQFTLFDYMNRAGYAVCHLGMRSGVLESVALMGARVIYMEESGNEQGPRVFRLAKSMGNYKRLELNRLPTHRGKDFQRREDKSWISKFKDAKGDLARYSKESFGDVSSRLTRVEKAVPSTGGFDAFLQAYALDAAPAWKARHFGDPSNWNAYRDRNKKWADTFEDLLHACFQESVSRGFYDNDMTGVIAEVTAVLN